jgi:integrative and conjugative element protein (TIGR02256 family)
VSIWLERPALVSILSEAQASSDGRETGGLLVGFQTENGVVITQAGEPGPNAIRKRDFFLRDLAYAECVLQNAYGRTGAVWVGDWHTHIVRCDRPSRTDSDSYRTLLDDDELRFDAFIALIVTSESSTFCDARISAWTASLRGLERAKFVL